MVEEFMNILIKINMMENGKMEFKLELAYIILKKEINIKENLKKDYLMVMENLCPLMGVYMKEIILTD